MRKPIWRAASLILRSLTCTYKQHFYHRLDASCVSKGGSRLALTHTNLPNSTHIILYSHTRWNPDRKRIGAVCDFCIYNILLYIFRHWPVSQFFVQKDIFLDIIGPCTRESLTPLFLLKQKDQPPSARMHGLAGLGTWHARSDKMKQRVLFAFFCYFLSFVFIRVLLMQAVIK